MINARKSILSLWKGMKGRLSAILKKRRKESGENCQSTATERKSISSGQTAETAGKDADAEILAAIDAIEFDFGQNRFTTAQAELLFVYQTGLDLDRLYVIALSRNCGAVIFYIPDDLAWRIVERALESVCTVGKYLADLVEFRLMGERAAASAMADPVLLHPERKANNWLKMHGFPMRRKGKGRRRHE